MEAPASPADPRTVLERLSRLQVAVEAAEGSEPGTPADSPTCIDDDLKGWLDEALGGVSNASAAHEKVYAKLLVSNAAAGSIIGKAGSNINDFQARTFARLQLSKAGEFYPGTAERTLLVTGRLKQIIAALSLAFAKLLREGVAPLSPRTKAGMDAASADVEATDNDPRLLIKLLVPQPLCGIIIGKSGATVRSYAADTHTQIRVTSTEGPAMCLNHRIVTVAGRPDDVLKAIAVLVLKQCEDPKFTHFAELPASFMGAPMLPALGGLYPPGAFPVVPAPGGPMPGMQHIHYHPAFVGAAAPPPAAPVYAPPPVPYALPAPDPYPTSMVVALSEDQAQVLMGRSGRGLDDVQSAFAVHMRVEAPEGYGPLPGGGKGRIRRLTISGAPEGIHYAGVTIQQRLHHLAMQQQAQAAQISPRVVLPPPTQPGMYAAGPIYPGSQVNGTTYYAHPHPYQQYQQDGSSGRPSPRSGRPSPRYD